MFGFKFSPAGLLQSCQSLPQKKITSWEKYKLFSSSLHSIVNTRQLLVIWQKKKYKNKVQHQNVQYSTLTSAHPRSPDLSPPSSSHSLCKHLNNGPALMSHNKRNTRTTGPAATRPLSGSHSTCKQSHNGPALKSTVSDHTAKHICFYQSLCLATASNIEDEPTLATRKTTTATLQSTTAIMEPLEQFARLQNNMDTTLKNLAPKVTDSTHKNAAKHAKNTAT